MAKEIILTILGSLATLIASVWAIVKYFIERKEKQEAEIEAKRDAERKELLLSSTRNELYILINHYPTQTFEIMRTAEKYFVELKGNFTATSIFQQYLKEHNLTRPDWFTEKDN